MTATDPTVDLAKLAEKLRTTADTADAGRAAQTLTPGAGRSLTQTVLALKADAELAEHTAPGPATLLVLDGTVTLNSGDGDVRLEPQQWTTIPRDPHRLYAETAAVVLLTVATASQTP